MQRLTLHFALGFLGFVAFTANALSAAPATSSRLPNIIFIIADDLGHGDLGSYGQKLIKTPHLDRMAAEGMRFTQHYSGNAVCAPSRCVLMTGLHPGHAFVRDNRATPPEGQWPIPDAAITLPELLKKSGYTTGGFGKWGLGGPGSTGEPLKQGFDRWYGYNCQSFAHSFYPEYLWDNDQKVTINTPAIPGHGKLEASEDPARPASYARFQGGSYSADLISAKAFEFIQQNKEKPFYLFWPTTVPHLALQVPEDSVKQYAGQWEDPPYPGGNGYVPNFAPRATYAGMISRMDRDIGKAMTLVTDLGLDENTVFIFVSDNGPLYDKLGGTDCEFFNSHGGLRGRKGSLYEGGFRVPCIVRWKSHIRAGSVSNHVTGFEDWLPTLLELAGAKSTTPSGLDGISFAPTLLGQSQPPRPFLYREFPNYGGQQAVRMGDWKAVRQNLNPKRGKNAKKPAPPPVVKTELYDLKNDPTESQDVASTHPEIVSQIEAIMKREHVNNPDFPFPILDVR